MKKILVILIGLSLSGCVSVLVQKEIQVKKDANGKVIETIETERVIQRGAIKDGIQFDYLKNKQDASKPIVIYGQ
jgi:hypothetical protein